MRIRTEKESNYHALYCDGKTLRIPLDPKKPITKLKNPEFYDVKITSYCTGRCPYCYMSSTDHGTDVANAAEKIKQYFGDIPEENRPFQVAIGGGNPNQHLDFVNILKTFYELGIVPNYTTNGLGLSDDICEATKRYCGGVAVSLHTHLKDIPHKAAKKLLEYGVLTSYNYLISDEKSVNEFVDNFFKHPEIKYHVLLPQMPQGRAETGTPQSVRDFLFECLEELSQEQLEHVAFGANFYEDLKQHREIKMSIYEPEVFSRYLDLETMTTKESSFA